MKFSKNEINAFIKGYYVDNNGNVYGPKGNIVGFNINNYEHFGFRVNKKKILIKTSRYVALFKYGNRLYTDGFEVRHLNGNSKDNTFNNIAIGTHSENMMDVAKNIRINNARNAPKITYSKELVKEIREYYFTNKPTYYETMEKFNISNSGTLWHILYTRYIE